MTIANELSSVTFTGNGATTVFPFTFLIPADTIRVSIVEDGIPAVLTEDQYTVSGLGNPAGGSVTYNPSGTPIPSTTRLVIERRVPYTQTLSIENQQRFYADVIMNALDRVVMQIQQLKALSDRTIRTEIGSPVLPLLTFEGGDSDNRAILFGPDSESLVLGPTASEIAGAQAVANDAENSAVAAAASADEAAASAASLNAANLLTKTGNLAGLADTNVAQTNLGITEAGRNFLDDANAAEQRATLGLLTAAQRNAAGAVAANTALPDNNAVIAYVAAQITAQTGFVLSVASNDASIEWTWTGTPAAVEINLDKILPATDGAILEMEFSTDGGATWKTGASDYQWFAGGVVFGSTNTSTDQNDADNAIRVAAGAGNAAGELGVSGNLTIHNPANGALTTVQGTTIGKGATGAHVFFGINGTYLSTDTVNGARIKFTSGNITSGTAGIRIVPEAS